MEAVSCGAILSNYQRFRVENVCSRLGLIPLHYLWQRNRESLLTEMLQSGLHAVLLKVAGGGLEPTKHVGKDLGAMRPTFDRLRDRFGLDICGEGGEYESLVLDCPLFSRRIRLTQTRVVVDRDDPSVGYLAVDGFETEPKDAPLPAAAARSLAAGVPPAATPATIAAAEGALHFPVPKPVLSVGLDGFGCTSLLCPMPGDTSPAADQLGQYAHKDTATMSCPHCCYCALQRAYARSSCGASSPNWTAWYLQPAGHCATCATYTSISPTWPSSRT